MEIVVGVALVCVAALIGVMANEIDYIVRRGRKTPVRHSASVDDEPQEFRHAA